MSRRIVALSLASALAVTSIGLTARPASAHYHHMMIPFGHGAAGSAWPAWVLIGGVLSLMLRAAVVQANECRELTLEEAVTGMVPVWIVYRDVNNLCGIPVRRRR